ncbi:MAG: hypothetical protein EPO22_06825 [Dehalococcoidia bacterium]|nr:MAG: hypothetical protein EPO22_06825 [Dehalococcoidia bacterium]
MRILRETRTITLSRTPGRTVEGRVRVRGFDLKSDVFDAHAERHEPVEIVVTELGQERRYRMPRPERPAMVMAALAAPIVARAIARTLKPRRSR